MICLKVTHYIVIYFMNLYFIFVLLSKFWSNMEVERFLENMLIKCAEIIICTVIKMMNQYIAITRSKIKQIQPNKIFWVCTSFSIKEPM